MRCASPKGAGLTLVGLARAGGCEVFTRPDRIGGRRETRCRLTSSSTWRTRSPLFFASQPREDQVERVAGHLRDFWDPSMRAQLLEIVEAGHPALTPTVAAAAGRLRD